MDDIHKIASPNSIVGDPFAMEKAAEAVALYPDDDTIFSLYRILTYGQQRIIEGEQLYKQATELYEAKKFLAAAELFAKSVDKDPLLKTYSLNTGLAYYESKNFDMAIKYFDLAMTSRRDLVKERALRFKALSLYAKLILLKHAFSKTSEYVSKTHVPTRVSKILFRQKLI